MRTLARAILCVLGAALPACALHHEITRAEIQAQLAEHFPIEKGAGLWKVRIATPRLRLTAPGRAGVALSVEAGGFGVPTLTALADVEGTPEYRSAEGAFYLQGFAVRRLDLAGQLGDAEPAIRVVVGAAIAAVLRDHPVYVLDPKRSGTEALLKGHVRRIWVTPDRLVVEYHL